MQGITNSLGFKMEDKYFPAKVINVTAVVIPNGTCDGYLYSGLAHLEGGVVVPFSYDKTDLVWHLTDVSLASADMNGAFYVPAYGRWIPVYAVDSPDMMEYLTAGSKCACSQTYPEAIDLGWDEGHKVDGHASVTTNRLSFKITDNYVTAVDTYTETIIGTWTH